MQKKKFLIGGHSLKWWFYAVQGKYFPESEKELWAMHVVKKDIEKILNETDNNPEYLTEKPNEKSDKNQT